MQLSCEKSADRLLAEGRKHLAEKKWADAEIAFRKVLQQNPSDGRAHLELGRALYAEGKGIDALREFAESVRVSPDNAEARRLYAEILLTIFLADPERATEQRREILRVAELEIAREANSLAGWRLKGLVARAESKQEEAVNAFRKALAARPGDAEITRALAEVLALRPESRPEAEALLEGAVKRSPQDWKAYKAWAEIYAKAGNFAKAETILEEAKLRNPGVSAVAIELAALYRRQNQVAKSQGLLDDLAKNSSQYPSGRIDAGDFLYAAKDLEGALNFYRAGWQGNGPRKIEYGKRILRVLSEQGKLDESRTIVGEILVGDPKDLEARTAQALLDMDRGDVAAAKQKLEELSREYPANHTLHFHLGRAYARAGETTKASAEWRQAIQLAPGAAQPRLSMARMLLEQGKAREALEMVGTALRLQPDNPEAMHLRITSLQALDQWDEAKSAIREFRQQYPKSSAIELDEAYVLLRDGKYASAEALFRKQYRVGAGDMRQIGGYAKALVASGKKAEAQRLVEAEAARAPANVSLQYMLAETYLENGRRDQAISVLSALRSAQPRFLLPSMRLATLYMEERKAGEAIALLRQLNAMAPGRPEILTLLAQAQEANADWSGAKATYREALQRNSQNVLAANGLANLIVEHGSDIELSEALRLAMQAKSMAPRDGLVLDTLGMVYLRRKEKEMAIAELQAASRLLPNNSKIKEHLALARSN